MVGDGSIFRIFPLGRGVNYKGSFNFATEIPFCTKMFVNIKQFPYQITDNKQEHLLNQFLKFHNSTGALCTPLIDINGNIKLGESIFCKTIANITDTSDRILKNIQDFIPCNKCGVELTYEKLISKIKK